jgi:recombination protein RecT
MPELQDPKQREQAQRTNATILEDYLDSDRFLDHLKQILPAHLDSDRFCSIALRQLSAIPELKLCTLASVAGGIMQAGTLGLEIGTQGECWLIPRQEGKGDARHWEASLQIGYLGSLTLAWRSEHVAGLQVDIVSQGDAFDYQKGTNGYIHHKPGKDRRRDEGSIQYAYAIIETTFGGTVWDVIDHAEIERIRNSGPSGNSPAWRNWYDQQAIAKVLKRVLKYCPKSRELARAIALDDLHDANVHQSFDVDLAVLPAEVARTESERQAEEIRRQAASQGSQEGRNSDEPPPPGDQATPPTEERELVPAERKAPAQDEGGSSKGSLGF